MEKIPVPPYRTYLAKYKVMSVAELETAKNELETKMLDANEHHLAMQSKGDRNEEYEAWLTLRNFHAEMETLNSVLHLKRIEEAE